MQSPQPNPEHAPRPCAERPSSQPQVLASTELMRGAREVLIEHAGMTYRLIHTRNDKLILTK